MRHGEGVDDIEDRYGGWGDLPLSKKGKEQVKDSIKRLEKYDIDLILSSPLLRAKETAEIVSSELGIESRRWLFLKERNTYGLMSGEVKSEIEKEYPELHKAYEDDEWVLGSERYEDLVARLKVMMRKLQEFDAETILAVTHGKVLAAISKEFLNKKLDKKVDSCLMEVEIDGDTVELVSVEGITFKK